MATGYYNKIVQVNVSAQYAPEPSTLQESAAIVAENSTTLTAGTTQFIADPSSLSSYLKPASTISSISWSAGTVTVVLTSAHGLSQGTIVPIIISGVAPSAYNGTFVATAAANTSTLLYSLASDPGVSTVPGFARYGADAWLVNADKTWWAQNGQSVGYYLFESGSTTSATITTAVSTYIGLNPKQIYNWCFLPGIDGSFSTTSSFFNSYNALTSLVKFYMPVSPTTAPLWQSSDYINVFAMVQTISASTISELDSVAYAAFITNIRPTPTNKLPPSSYAYLYGVTPTALSNTLMQTYTSSNINFASTGAEGGISNTILVMGDNLDGTPQNVAYSIDWQQIQMDLSISNAVINGSNSQINPLLYNQEGINRLQAVAGNVASLGISSGLALGRVILVQMAPDEFSAKLSAGEYAGNYVINAVPFATYVAANPADYAQGLYGGLQASFVPQFGFKRIVFNIEATQFAA